ncbi:uncharacterized protein LOC105846415 isoform X2 [Hydra vulgaris]
MIHATEDDSKLSNKKSMFNMKNLYNVKKSIPSNIKKLKAIPIQNMSSKRRNKSLRTVAESAKNYSTWITWQMRNQKRNNSKSYLSYSKIKKDNIKLNSLKRICNLNPLRNMQGISNEFMNDHTDIRQEKKQKKIEKLGKYCELMMQKFNNFKKMSWPVEKAYKKKSSVRKIYTKSLDKQISSKNDIKGSRKSDVEEGLENANEVLNKIYKEPNIQLEPITYGDNENFENYAAEFKNPYDIDNLAYACDLKDPKIKDWYSKFCEKIIGNNFNDGNEHFYNEKWKPNHAKVCKYIAERYKSAGLSQDQLYTDSILTPCDDINYLMYSKYGDNTLMYNSHEDNAYFNGNNNDEANYLIEPLNSPMGIKNIEKDGLLNSLIHLKESEKGTYDQVGLKAHNIFRKIHGVADLLIDTQLTTIAQKQATYLASIQTLKPDLVTDEGSNVAYGCYSDESDISTTEAVIKWYFEVCKSQYVFGTEGSSENKHFTQLVWRSSKYFGMGKAVSKKNGLFCTYIVALYKPRGNIMSQYKENVLPGLFQFNNPCNKLESLLAQSKNLNYVSIINDYQVIDESGKESNAIRIEENDQVTFFQQGLQLHNIFRKIHGVADLQLDMELSENAKKYAAKLAILQVLKPSNIKDEGENLAYKCDKKEMTAEDAVKEWYSEVCKHSYNFSGEGSQNTVHFTQVVWKSSTYFGMGKATFKKDDLICTYIVARYRPRGNIVFKYKENVVAGFFDSARTCSNLDSYASSVMQVSGFNGVGGIAVGNSATITFDSQTGDGSLNLLGKQNDLNTNQFDQVGLKAHNIFRKIHEVPELQLNAELSASAQKYALYLSDIQTLQHSNIAGEGENLGFQCFSDEKEASAANMVKDWYSEVCKHNYNFGGEGSQDTAHFTQVVWKSSIYFGMGTATSKKDGMICTYFVARYIPRGNIDSEYKNNVLSGSFSSTRTCNNLDNIAGSTKHVSGFTRVAELEEGDGTLNSLGNQNDLNANEFDQVGLRAHNVFRKIHNVPELQLNAELSASAQKYAVYLSGIKRLEHSNVADQGENLGFECLSGEQEASAANMVKDWYSEVCKHNYNFGGEGSLNTAHFTQVVWKSSTLLGMGKATSEKDGLICTYFVALYKPRGNMVSEYKENVLAGSFDSSSTCSNLESLASSAMQVSSSVGVAGITAGDSATSTLDSQNGDGTLNSLGNQNDLNANEFDQVGLRAHNVFRKIHNVPELQLNAELSASAQKYAVYLSGIKRLEHSNVADQGENLGFECFSGEQEASAANMVKDWYSEVCKHNYNFGGEGSLNTAHFTQVVWKSSTLLGMGKATSEKDGLICTYFVALYKPRGNMVSEYKENVLAGSFDSSSTCSNLESLASSAMQVSSSVGVAGITAGDSATSTLDSQNGDGTLNSLGNQNDLNANEFDQVGLRAHNVFRKIHNVPELQLNAELSASAQKYAVYLSGIKRLEHLNVADQGENLGFECLSGEQEASAANMVKDWYSEVCKHNYNFGGEGSLNTAHFTQVVWKSSTLLGMGKATSEKDGLICTYFVALYKPRGNMVSEYKENVLAGSFDSSSTCSNLESLASSAMQVSSSVGVAGITAGDSATSTLDSQNGDGTLNSLGNQNDLNANEFDQVGLRAHNVFRKIHNVPELQLNAELSASAQKYAVYLSGIKRLEHSNVANQGENLGFECLSGEQEASAANMVKDWYSEVCKHNYNFGGEGSLNTAHFTQVVWKSSTLLGMGKATSEKDGLICTYFVALYKPRGNMVSEYKENVLAGSFDSSSTCSNLESLASSAMQVSSSVGVAGITAGDSATSTLDSQNGNGTLNSLGNQNDLNANEFDQVGLRAHNVFRKIHNVPELQLNAELSASAQKYAVYLSGIKRLEHSNVADQGENLGFECLSGEQEASAANMVKDWYSEVCKHNYNFGGEGSLNTAHFTQVVWKSSTLLGMGKATSEKDGLICTYFVALYKPRGNMVSEYKENVLAGSFDSSSTCSNLESLASSSMQVSSSVGVAGITAGDSATSTLDSQNGDGTLNSLGNQNDLNANEFDQVGLRAHNVFRKIHNVPELQLNAELSASAQKYAVYLSGIKRLEHSNVADQGENLGFECLSGEQEASAANMVKDWYSEVCKHSYNFGGEGSQNTAHFTQVVWKSSTLFGMGKATSEKDGLICTYFVARYKPRGNIVSKYKENVLAGSFDSSSTCSNLESLASSVMQVSSSNWVAGIAAGDTATGTLDSQNGGGTLNSLGTRIDLNANEFDQVALRAHNVFRKIHNVPSLQLNAELSASAQKYAVYLSGIQRLQHSNVADQGENLGFECLSGEQEASAADMVKKWYSEVCKHSYNFGGEGSQNTAHFTQVVWKSSTLFGMGKATSEKDGLICTYFVARYKPRGNIVSKYKENVLAGSFDSSSTCSNLESLASSVMQVSSSNWVAGIAAGDTATGTLDSQNGGGTLNSLGTRIDLNANEFDQVALRAHNVFRKIHNVPSLQLNAELSASAQKYAVYLSGIQRLQHSNVADQGENLGFECLSGEQEASAADMVKKWYSEVCKHSYNFGGEGSQNTAHFTQVVWKSSTLFGMGKATSEKDGLICTYFVARYKPRGNIVSKYKENVLAGSFDSSSTCSNLESLASSVMQVSSSNWVAGIAAGDTATGTLDSQNGGGTLNSLGTRIDLNANEFDQVALRAHNVFRKIHNVPSLQLNAELSASAQKYAVYLSGIQRLQHSNVADQGENLGFECLSGEQEASAADMVKKWYSEVCKHSYNFGGEGSQNTAHFTQVVWKSSTLFGMGKATSEKDGLICTYFVARYKPRGNIVSKYKENVLAGSFDSSSTCSNLESLASSVMQVSSSNWVAGIAAGDTATGTLDSQNGGGTLNSLGTRIDLNANEFDQVALRAHNVFRKIHNVPSLQLNAELSASAQKYAVYLSGIQRLQHSNVADQGENLGFECLSGEQEASAADMVKKWYSEVCKHSYNFGGEGSQNTAHFTQVVWKSSTLFGMGKATSEKDGLICTYFVARYKPRGNIVSKYKENVLAGSFDSSSTCSNLESLASSVMQVSSSNWVAGIAAGDTATGTLDSQNGGGTLNSLGTRIDLNANEFDQVALRAHNVFRKIHNVPSLQLNAELSASAQKYAVYLSGIQRLQHSNVADQGENLGFECLSGEQEASAADMVKKWYSEVCKHSYNFGGEGSQNTAHFTQVVWKSSTLFGMGKATSEKDGLICTYFVARYKPRGNIVSKYKENVLAGSFDSSSTCSNLESLASSVMQVSSSNWVAGIAAGDTATGTLDSQNGGGTLNSLGTRIDLNANEFDQVALRAHNVFRKIHNVPSLQLNAELSASAQKYAVYLSGIQRLQHSNVADQGENLGFECLSGEQEASAADMVKKWYSEVCKHSYNFGGEGSQNTAHFTQVVWKSSTLFGMGKATSEKDGLICTYFVARYKPRGNIVSKYKENVLAGSFDSSSTCSNLESLASSVMQVSSSNWVAGIAAGDTATGTLDSQNGGGTLNSLGTRIDLNANEFDQVGLRAHNVFRKIHGVSDLHLSAELSLSAQRYAFYLSTIGRLEHSNNLDLGENLAYQCFSDKKFVSATVFVKDWYSEVCNKEYEFGSEGSPDTSHFTQVIWSESTSLGMGKATLELNGMSCVYVVARYKPRGNVASQYASNVLRGTFNFKDTCKSLDSLLTGLDIGSTVESNVYKVPLDFSIGGNNELMEKENPISVTIEKESLNQVMADALNDNLLFSKSLNEKNFKSFRKSVSDSDANLRSLKSARKNKIKVKEMFDNVNGFLKTNSKKRKLNRIRISKKYKKRYYL